MNGKNTLLYIVIGALGLWLFWKVNKKPLQQAAKIVTAMTRGYRNNNPGNIVLTYNSDGSKRYWSGEIEGTDSRFKTFKSMAYGYRAIFALLREYISKGYNTIEKVINRYAPSVENNTNAYITTVVKRVGISQDVKISGSDLVTLTKLVKAISFVENGLPANEIEVDEGKKLLM